MRKLRLLTLSSLAILFIASSCTKEGPEGPAGATGAQGPAGSPGTPGAPGAGQTTYSAWFTTTAADWADAYSAPYWALSAFTKAAPAVTQDIIDKGVILSYMKNWTFYGPGGVPTKSTNVVQLPFVTDIDLVDVIDFVIPQVGQVKYLYKSNAQFWTADELAGTTFRYVIIPGSNPGGRNTQLTYGGYTLDELKRMPYEEVAAKFSIPANGTNIK